LVKASVRPFSTSRLWVNFDSLSYAFLTFSVSAFAAFAALTASASFACVASNSD